MRIITICLALLSTPVAAHEFWIEPLEWQIAPDDTLQAKLVNGSEFAGVDFAFLPQRFTRFDLAQNGTLAPVASRLGARPAIDQVMGEDGLVVAVYVSTLNKVTYEERATFDKFVVQKDLGAVARDHEARGLPEAGFSELFTRYSKALVAVGEGEGEDRRFGLETELVALDNPYTGDLSEGMRVQLFYGEETRDAVQVELYERTPEGEVTEILLRTNENGVAVLPVKPGHDYLASAVVLREPEAGIAARTDTVWESLWAALSFAVPD
ncbi:DUF4198 domain-containing protein [Limimaricola litoreus]|uniref:DUF4198 domain-containing protein n=1 Tax=Limimaricola litoreus TaxID=2955316 RepID=A0A9X2FN68_9RHOB|nr:DUF4198 domain-containing protein [Limimaricola litoreus]MCP1168034.1 DUF4198 domain-containing protein [Limimaricola litoreus]